MRGGGTPAIDREQAPLIPLPRPSPQRGEESTRQPLVPYETADLKYPTIICTKAKRPNQAACLPINPGISTGSISSDDCPAVASLVCIQVISSKLPSAFSAIAVQLSTQSPVLM